MKKNKDIFEFFLGLFFITFLCSLVFVGGYTDTHYTAIAIVYKVEPDLTTFIDGAGYLWRVGRSDFTEGQTVKIYFHNNCTDYTREDDEILKVKVLEDDD